MKILENKLSLEDLEHYLENYLLFKIKYSAFFGGFICNVNYNYNGQDYKIAQFHKNKKEALFAVLAQLPKEIREYV